MVSLIERVYLIMQAPRLRELALVVGSSAFAITLSLFAAEAAVRYRERNRDTVPGTMPQLYYRHARLGHALVRNNEYFRWVHTNERGFRGTRPTALAEDPATLRVFAVGGSTTFDSFVSADSTAWPAVLERELASPAGGKRVEIVNAGVPGYGVVQDLIRLETDLQSFSPRLILFLQGHNDLFGLLAPENPGADQQRPDEVSPASRLTYWLERHSFLYAKVAARVGVIRFRQRGPASAGDAAATRSDEEILSSATARFRQRVRSYFAVAKAHGIEVYVLPLTHVAGVASQEPVSAKDVELWRQTVPFASAATVLEGYRRFNKVLEEAAAEFGFVMLQGDDLAVTGEAAYFEGDPIHFSDAGAERFGKAVARALSADARFRVAASRE